MWAYRQVVVEAGAEVAAPRAVVATEVEQREAQGPMVEVALMERVGVETAEGALAEVERPALASVGALVEAAAVGAVAEVLETAAQVARGEGEGREETVAAVLAEAPTVDLDIVAVVKTEASEAEDMEAGRVAEVSLEQL